MGQPLRAQDFDRYRPKPLPGNQGDARLPDVPKAAAGDPTVLIESLKALVFVDHRDKVGLKGGDSGIHVEGDLRVAKTPGFRRIAEAYLGKPVSVLRMNELAREVIIYYRKNNEPVVDVSVPPQDITDGIVYVVITEGRVGNVVVENAGFFDPCMLADQVCVRPGDHIYETRLLSDVRWLNRNPFRTVELALRPGDEFGETDIVFDVQDKFPLRGYVGYEDTGTRPTGIERTIYGFTYGNMFGRDHQFAYQHTASSDFKSVLAHSGIYSIPLPNRDEFLMFGSYATIASVAAPFGLDGLAWQTSWRYNRNLVDCPDRRQRLVAGFDFKQNNTNLDFGGTTVFASSADIAQIMLGYYGWRGSKLGYTALGVDTFIGPGGGFSPGNSDAAFGVIRAGAKAQYIYTRAFVEGQRELPGPFNLYGRLTGQLAGGNLLPSEQLGFGGSDSIRGYDMRFVNGDSGYISNLELRTDVVELGLDRCGKDQLQFLCFYDLGVAYNHTLLPGEDPSVDLNSVGTGLRYLWNPTVSLRADYGWQLNDVAGDVISSRWHVGLVLSR